LREGFDITVHDARSVSVKTVAKMSGGERIWINECLARSKRGATAAAAPSRQHSPALRA